LVIEGYRIFIGAKLSDDLIQLIALFIIHFIVAIVGFLGLEILVELFQEKLAFPFQFLLLF